MAQVNSGRRAKAAADSALSDATATGREAVDAFRDVADTFGERSRIRSSAGPTRRSRSSPASASCSAPPGGAQAGTRGKMFSQLLAPLQAKVNLALISAVCYAAAGIAGAIALAFGIAALFTWLDDHYGTIAACLIVAGVFVVWRSSRSSSSPWRARRKSGASCSPPPRRASQWINPATLSLGLQAARMLGRNRGVAMAAVGSVLAGWLISQMMGDEEETEEEEAAEPAE